MALMAKAKAVMGFMAVLVLIGAADVAAQSANCSAEIDTLGPCLGFVPGGDQKPSTECCNNFTKVVTTNVSCFCQVLNGNSGINVTWASTLPQACNVTTPITCSLEAPAPAPAPAPVVSAPVPVVIPPAPAPNAGAVFSPSMVVIVSVATLVLMKTLS